MKIGYAARVHEGSESGASVEGTEESWLSEPWADTTTHADKMIMTVFAGIAEFERELIRESTGAGRHAALKRVVKFGRPRKLNPDQVRVACELLLTGKSVREVASTFNIHVATVYWLQSQFERS